MKSFYWVLLALFFLCFAPTPEAFKTAQLKYERVKTAYQEKESTVKHYFEAKKLRLDQSEIFIRVFKQEKIVELWAKSKTQSSWQLVKTYSVCASSGTLGPKRRQGDLQVPEGFYTLDKFNPVSNFYLSLGVNYPNVSDRIIGGKGDLGGDIFIHGNCVTIGCLPLTDDKIKELYVAVVEAKSGGQTTIPVHIFPAKLDDEGFTQLQATYAGNVSLIQFWQNLKEGYDRFEKNKQLPVIKVDFKGKYVFS
jgi:murein L,D-transpeptidase YafK